MQDRYDVPEIFPVETHDQLDGIHQDIQFVLKVPLVNFIFRTLAYFDSFFVKAWEQVRGNMLTIHMEKAAKELRHPPLSLDVPSINWREVYDSDTLQRLQRIVFSFHYANPKLLLMVNCWAESLSNRPIPGSGQPIGSIPPGHFPGNVEIPLMPLTEASAEIRQLLEEIAEIHHTFEPASEYRALAYFPEFLTTSWSCLKPYVGTDEYRQMESHLLTESIRLARTMPYPVTISREELETCCTAQEIARIMGVVSMLQQVLPGLIIDGEYFRRMLRA